MSDALPPPAAVAGAPPPAAAPTAPPPGVAIPREVAIRLADGRVGTVPGDQLPSFVREGAQVILPAELHQEELRARYQGTEGLANAFAQEALNGVSLGTLDYGSLHQALTGQGREASDEAIRASEELHPLAAAAGGLVGAIANPVLGEIGTAGEAAGIGVAGTGATTALGRIAQRSVALGARGATENAVLSLAQAVGQADLADTPLSGEKLAASLGYGALTGFVTGGALGGAGQALSEARVAASPALRRAAASEAARAIGLSAQSPKVTRKAIAYLGKDANVRIGEELLERGIVTPGADAVTMLERTQAAREEVGQAIGAKLQNAAGYSVKGTTPAFNARPLDLYTKLDELAAPYERSASQGYVADQLHAFQERLGRQFGIVDDAGNLVPDAADKTISFEALHAETQALGDQLYRQQTALPDAAKLPLAEMRDFHRSLKTYLEEKLDAAESALDRPGWREEYGKLKASYQTLSHAEEALKNKVRQSLDNRRFSLTDTIMMGSGLQAAAAGHPGALGAGLVNHGLRTKGPQVAAWALNRVATMGAVAGEVSSFDRLLDRAVNGFVDVAKREDAQPLLHEIAVGRKEPSPGELVQAYDEHAEQVKAAMIVPNLPAQVAQRLGDFQHHAPQLAQGVAATTGKAVAFLASKLPPAPAQDPLRPSLHMRPSATQMAKFLRYARAADDPAGVLEDLRQNRLSPEAIEAMKSVYPGVYGEVRKRVMNRIQEEDKPMTYQARLQLAALFDVPAGPTLSARSRATSAAVWAGQGEGGGAAHGGPAGGKGSLRAGGSHKVDTSAFQGTSAGDTLEGYADKGSAGKD